MKKIAIVILIVLTIGAGSLYGVKTVFNRSHSSLSEDKVSQMIIEKYGGTIKKIGTVQQNYKLTLVKDQIQYDITVNGRTGEVISFTKQTFQETKNTRKLEQKEPQDSNKSNVTPITKEKAKQLALEKVSGKISSAELDKEDGQLVYEVGIHQSKTKKCTIVINAYSGEIESISFETDEED
ncbi:PepSY domain-containing protein [Bacillus sp. EB600]|uniref:PepSY domain-containing protein n=1 Tax=Bacillus sp. EB600 TaxID=2806345 RepID=UPI0021088599|nr:PepSY domain-containing protein [Bacillus sp. EB600]MCQ6282357.1 PepSY domain-containing protein [Bacillus sp. EB600]